VLHYAFNAASLLLWIGPPRETSRCDIQSYGALREALLTIASVIFGPSVSLYACVRVGATGTSLDCQLLGWEECTILRGT
jgi:hypothetical protein